MGKDRQFHRAEYPDRPNGQLYRRLQPYRASVLPQAALEQGLSADITVECKVDAAGIAHDCTAGPGPEPLRQAAVADFSLARYYPAMRDGAPVESPFTGHLNWKVDETPGGFR